MLRLRQKEWLLTRFASVRFGSACLGLAWPGLQLNTDFLRSCNCNCKCKRKRNSCGLVSIRFEFKAIGSNCKLVACRLTVSDIIVYLQTDHRQRGRQTARSDGWMYWLDGRTFPAVNYRSCCPVNGIRKILVLLPPAAGDLYKFCITINHLSRWAMAF